MAQMCIAQHLHLDHQRYVRRNRRESLSGDEKDSYRGLNVPRGSHPLGEVAIEVGGRGHQRSHKLSFSLATEWRNARTALPPNF